MNHKLAIVALFVLGGLSHSGTSFSLEKNPENVAERYKVLLKARVECNDPKLQLRCYRVKRSSTENAVSSVSLGDVHLARLKCASYKTLVGLSYKSSQPKGVDQFREGQRPKYFFPLFT